MNWLYEKNDDNTSRYILSTVGERPLVCFGINPSTAAPEHLDNTVKSVQRIALGNGFDSWIMLNIYPQRSTDPNNLHSMVEEELHKTNIIHIEKIFKKYEPTIWAAWGTIIEKRSYLPACLSDIIEISHKYNYRWVSFGKVSKKGHPHHPLYLNKSTDRDEFPVDDYMKNNFPQSHR